MRVIALFLMGCALGGPLTVYGASVADGDAADQKFSASLWGAYSNLSMASANGALNYAKTSAQSSGAQITQYTQLGPGWEAGLDLGYRVLPGLTLGPRVEWIQAVDGEINAAGSGLTTDISYGAFLIPVMVGADYDYSLGRGFSLFAGAYAGCGFASISEKASGSNTAGSGEADYWGARFCSDLDLGARYRISRHLSAQVQLGYQFADVPVVAATGNGTGIFDTVSKGNEAVIQGKPVAMDFSGVNVGGGLSLDF